MTSPKTQYYLEQCRRHMMVHGRTIKVAELGGDGQNASFEQSFSNLAHAYLRDSAPSLLDHELGFQLLDRNQDNTKAVGVFAFKVGSQTLFAPVFFLQGDLKGHELLYLKAQDMFVPLKENWLNYILNRKPNILGTGVDRRTSDMGVMQPDLQRLSQAPGKYASVIPSVREFVPLYGHLATTGWGDALTKFADHCQTKLDLGHFLKQASLPMLEMVVKTFKQRPKLAAAFDHWHGMDTLRDAIREAKVRLDHNSILDNPYCAVNRNQIETGSILKTAAKDDDGPDTKGKIEIITTGQSWVSDAPEGLDEADAEKLLKENLLIKDHRDGDEVSVPVQMQVEKRLTNPTETGIYQVLVKPGDFERCLVITDPVGPAGRTETVTVVRLDEGSKNWGNFHKHNVFVVQQEEEMGGEEDWNKFYDGLSDSKSLSASSEGRYIIIGARRNATCPFRVSKEIGSSNGSTSFEVDFSRHPHPSSPRVHSLGLSRYRDSQHYLGFDEYDEYRDGQRIHIDSKDGTQFRSNAGDVYIPKEHKVLKVTKDRSDKDEDGCCCVGYPGDGSETPPIQPGNLTDASLSIMTKTAALRVAAVSGGYRINESPLLKSIPAIIHLVKDHGFTEKMSRHMLKEADSRKVRAGGAFECRVKYASPFLTQGAPNAPAFPQQEMGGFNPMGFQGQTVDGTPQEMQVPDMSSGLTDRSVYNVNPANTPDPMDINSVQQAAATGQKEIFDTAMIGSMLKTVRDDTMIDRYIPDLIKGMDRLGRILFMFYWHQDRFSERYGKQDLPELEDAIRNAFEMLGDTVMFLKQKTIEPYPEEDTTDMDLGSTAEI